MRVAIPGIGGNLGECVVCGKTFLSEILLGTLVSMVHVEGFSRDLPVHQKPCLLTLQSVMDSGGDWRKLPEGPLRNEFSQVHDELQTKNQSRSAEAK